MVDALGDGASSAGVALAAGDFLGETVGDAFPFFFFERLGEAFPFFFLPDGVAVDALLCDLARADGVVFFFGDAFGVGLGVSSDSAALTEATRFGCSSSETCA